MDQTNPTAPYTIDPRLGLLRASGDVWKAIADYVDREVDRRIRETLLNSTDLANVACTMGAPDVPLVASTKPWAHVVVPYFSKLVRVEYFQTPWTGTFQCDVKLVRPGQELSSAATLYPGMPPSILAGITRINPDDDWITYVEPGTVLLFYLTSVSGCELVTANVILRTLRPG